MNFVCINCRFTTIFFVSKTLNYLLLNLHFIICLKDSNVFIVNFLESVKSLYLFLKQYSLYFLLLVKYLYLIYGWRFISSGPETLGWTWQEHQGLSRCSNFVLFCYIYIPIVNMSVSYMLWIWYTYWGATTLKKDNAPRDLPLG